MTQPNPKPDTKPSKPAPTAIDVLAKIQRLLAPLSDEDRKRVVAFLSH